MRKLILIFSHSLTDKQIEDSKVNLYINEFIYLPKELQGKWSLIPPDMEDISNITDEIKDWIDSVADKDDYILVQGDFGATYDVVKHLKNKGHRVIYSTTSRRAKEIVRDDGKIEITHIFDHVMYREY
ncbi:hypothetical protein SAMN05660462_02835 [Proteiniborus ethanoligenes]|uniref:CRISPR-associated protein n=1 Tax=Proteiniborus ethanoligenes TaxID=415015 RepID=A0A1H3SCE5_9FIRM|nr:CRISPR-associated protein Csx20 [Proteiniborus ethanoligenes]SDZ35743.1 hypothetical protein SAMN05660462_02835 [Proteiniborus ethanoligenes]